MLKWVQGSVSALTGAAEPEYGREAFRSIDETVPENGNPYGELKREDLEWRAPWSSNVETQTFYFYDPDSGYYGFAQVIHSNPMGINFTAQFTCLVLNNGTVDASKKDYKVWTSTSLDNFSTDKTDFHADGLDIKLNEAADEYTMTSVVTEDSLVDLKFSRGETLGMKIGADGTSIYGEDLKAPWGSMRHVFWPRTSTSGKINLSGHEVVLGPNTTGMYVMALQGMKPHHAASHWNFLNFQGPRLSVIAMEFQTPPSYGKGTSSIGAVVLDKKLYLTAVNVKVLQSEPESDETGWPAPGAIEFELSGPLITASEPIDAKDKASVVVSGKLAHKIGRVDVMAEIPQFVKNIVAGVSGAKPYIYQYFNKLHAKLETTDGEVIEDDGYAFTEATFIS